MRQRAVAAAVATILVAGCATTRIPISSATGFEGLNQSAKGRTAQIVFRRGEPIFARNVRAEGDSLSWTSRWISEVTPGHWTERGGSADLADVRSVKIFRRARGALRGLGRGAAWGLGLALPLYLVNSGDPYSLAYLVVCPVLGAIVGFPLGLTSEADMYDFSVTSRTFERRS